MNDHIHVYVRNDETLEWTCTKCGHVNKKITGGTE